MGKRVLARNYFLEVYDGEKFYNIKGITNFTISQNVELADATTFDSNGQKEHTKAQNTKIVNIDGYFIENKDSELDEGQEVINNLSRKMGKEAETLLRISRMNTDKNTWLTGTFSLNDIGGSNNDHTSWGAEFQQTGKEKVGGMIFGYYGTASWDLFNQDLTWQNLSKNKGVF